MHCDNVGGQNNKKISQDLHDKRDKFPAEENALFASTSKHGKPAESRSSHDSHSYKHIALKDCDELSLYNARSKTRVFQKKLLMA